MAGQAAGSQIGLGISAALGAINYVIHQLGSLLAPQQTQCAPIAVTLKNTRAKALPVERVII
jgi:hypothetical protein